MASVLFIFVRADSKHANALAEQFDDAGFDIVSGSDALALDEVSSAIVVLSEAALQSKAFRVRAERAMQEGKAIVASLIGEVELHGATALVWSGDAKQAHPILEAADRNATRAAASGHAHVQLGRRSRVIELEAPRYVEQAPLVRESALQDAG